MHTINDIKSPVLSDLYRYWDSKRQHPRPLTHHDFEPTEIPDLLSYVVLLDVLACRKNLRYRLVGTHIVGAIGRDFTGETVLDFHRGFGDPAVIEGYLAMLATGQPQLEWHSLGNVDRAYVTYERLLLPMSRDGHSIDSILAGIQFHLPRRRQPFANRIAGLQDEHS